MSYPVQSVEKLSGQAVSFSTRFFEWAAGVGQFQSQGQKVVILMLVLLHTHVIPLKRETSLPVDKVVL